METFRDLLQLSHLAFPLYLLPDAIPWPEAALAEEWFLPEFALSHHRFWRQSPRLKGKLLHRYCRPTSYNLNLAHIKVKSSVIVRTLVCFYLLGDAPAAFEEISQQV